MVKANGDGVELSGLAGAPQRSNGDAVAVALPGAAPNAATHTFLSEEERDRHASGARRHGGAVSTVHTPCGAGAEQALEVSVLSLCGRAPSRQRRVAFGCAALLCSVACGFAGWAYPRDPEFTLNETQQAMGSVGVFVVLQARACGARSSAAAPAPDAHAGFARQAACALACVWFPGWFCRCTTSRCALAVAKSVLICCEDGSQHVAPVTTRRAPSGDDEVRCIVFRHVRFLYCADTDAFRVEEAADPVAAVARSGLLLTQGLADSEVERRAAWHGRNLIDVPMPSVPRQLADEVLNPFVFFQFFSCVQWCGRPHHTARAQARALPRV